jgi:hypothetical protein
MADVRLRTPLREWIDDYLEHLLRIWETLPSITHEWDSWTEDERLDFVIEWPIREDRLQQLQRWAAEGQLSPAQRVRYEELLRLIARQRPTLERLLAE